MAPNLALISIPAYYILAVIPHTYALTIGTKGDMSKLNNVCPRGKEYRESIKTELSSEEYARFERAEAAHQNSMENMPLYIGAVIAGLLAEQATKGTIGKTYVSSGIPTGLERFVYSWFAVRIAYTAAYITTTDLKLSYVRSALWTIGVGLCAEQFWRAAIVLGDGKVW